MLRNLFIATAALTATTAAHVAEPAISCASSAAELQGSLARYKVTEREGPDEDGRETRQFDPSPITVGGASAQLVEGTYYDGTLTELVIFLPKSFFGDARRRMNTLVPAQGTVDCDDEKCSWEPSEDASAGMLGYARLAAEDWMSDAILTCYYRSD